MTSDDQGVQQTVDDHGELKRLFDRIRECQESELADVCKELRGFLTTHFEHEEQSGGFFDFLYRHAERHRDLVARLRREHRSLLEDSAAICSKMSTGEIDDVRSHLLKLVRRLEDHESIERRVLKAAMEAASQAS